MAAGLKFINATVVGSKRIIKPERNPSQAPHHLLQKAAPNTTGIKERFTDTAIFGKTKEARHCKTITRAVKTDTATTREEIHALADALAQVTRERVSVMKG